MKHLYLFLICLLLTGLSSVYADDEGQVQEAPEKKPLFDSVITTHAGLFFGGMNEYVFQKGRSQELSRLEWDENFVPFIDLTADFFIKDFFLSVSVLTTLPVRSGIMRNYDYMRPDNKVSHFSEHDAMFDKHLEILPNIGWGIDIGRWYLGIAGGLIFRNRKWTAVDGYTQYPETTGAAWDKNQKKENMKGTIITYEETMWAPLVTLYADFSINDRFEICSFGSFYPYLDVTTVDTHILRTTRFQDHMQGGWGFLIDLSLVYHPKTSDTVSFIFGAGYEGMFPTKGYSASASLGEGKDADLFLDKEIQSQMSSNLFWVNIGVIIYPAKLFSR